MTLGSRRFVPLEISTRHERDTRNRTKMEWQRLQARNTTHMRTPRPTHAAHSSLCKNWTCKPRAFTNFVLVAVFKRNTFFNSSFNWDTLGRVHTMRFFLQFIACITSHATEFIIFIAIWIASNGLEPKSPIACNLSLENNCSEKPHRKEKKRIFLIQIRKIVRCKVNMQIIGSLNERYI